MPLAKALYNKYQAGVTPQHMREPQRNATPNVRAAWSRWKNQFDAGQITKLFDEWYMKEKQIGNVQ